MPFTWLHGSAGSGKTILSAGIIKDMQELCEGDPAKSLAYFFFDFKDAGKQDPVDMVKSLLSHFLNSCQSVPDTVRFLYATCENGRREASEHQLLQALKDTLELLPAAFAVLDALDECRDWGALFEILVEMQSWDKGILCVLLTSRKEIQIEEALEDIVPPVDRTCLESDLVDEDIRTFRWAACQLDTLTQCYTRGKVRRALQVLPKDLDETYARILRTIDEGHNAEEALKILTWLARCCLYWTQHARASRIVSKQQFNMAVLDAGADFNTQEDYDEALYVASQQGHEKAVQMLLAAGAYVNAQGGQYGDALQATSYGGNKKVVQMLLGAGADVNAQGGQYGNALQAASVRGNKKVVQIMLAAGARDGCAVAAGRKTTAYLNSVDSDIPEFMLYTTSHL
ncbi:hypothetical protein KC318_g468 [Hortaea werneckii]|nr:hypothetical protein KC334_g440 [Hortaea werneckii]KAI7027243.1 hypothetical protein KC355_g409 [Hortaea werneckii]KAI7676120.1 hypothetical protein KC318_g468 [Hortaea werneckii]